MQALRVQFGGKKSIFLGGTWIHRETSWAFFHGHRAIWAETCVFFAGVKTVGVGLAAGQWWGCFTGRNEDDLDHLYSYPVLLG